MNPIAQTAKATLRLRLDLCNLQALFCHKVASTHADEVAAGFEALSQAPSEA